MHEPHPNQPLNRPLALQGIYFLITGLWPLLHYRSFEAVTGPKVDDWLVRIVGALIAVIGGVVTMTALARRQRRETFALSYCSASALSVIGGWYALRRRISILYFVDAVGEFVLIGLIERARQDARATER